MNWKRNVQVDIRLVLVIALLVSAMLVGAKMLAPSGQMVINNPTNCIVEVWPGEGPQSATLTGDYKLIHDAFPPGQMGSKATIRASDPWANVMADCPNSPTIPVVSVQLKGPPEKDFTVNLYRDANGSLRAQADEVGGFYIAKKPLIGW